MYKSARKLFKDWPMSEYTENELKILRKIAIANKMDICVRIYGREYAHFYPNGEICPFEHDEIKKNGTLKMPPQNDKWVFYIFEPVSLGKYSKK